MEFEGTDDRIKFAKFAYSFMKLKVKIERRKIMFTIFEEIIACTVLIGIAGMLLGTVIQYGIHIFDNVKHYY